ncbi:Cobalt-precorrin-3B C(17)-methyltransferase [Synechococcus sp. MIT S9509]|nr:Cobalt-precorrin-3B C(17)-methyltransferase [Synechococcus sp. MIT S9504]KZR93570.1 Cobalt-precorrin-3B C(17)-methyltransferase [Synechococcus sp. MIT S9509]
MAPSADSLRPLALNAVNTTTIQPMGASLALGLSVSAWPLLQQLRQAGQADRMGLTPLAAAALQTPPSDLLVAPAAQLLTDQWLRGGPTIVVGALGAVTRLIAPLLSDKQNDPAVVVMDARGAKIVPLIGGHAAGAEQLAHALAAALGGQVVLTGDGASQQRLALDAFGEGWGWVRGGTPKDWHELMLSQASGHQINVLQQTGSDLWRRSGAGQGFAVAAESEHGLGLAIGPRTDGAPCRWHPATIWIGIGCERLSSLELIERAVDRSLESAGMAKEAVAGISSIEAKGDEPALLQLSEQRGWPLRLFGATALADVAVPTPSEVVKAEMGTASVAEASALLASGEGAQLLQAKQIFHAEGGEKGAVTVAIAEAAHALAPRKGELHLIGSGPGSLQLLTADAREALSRCILWVGYGLYLDLLEPLRRCDQVRLDGQLTRERDRCLQALNLARQGARVALISSGDSGIYGMAGLALELWLDLPQTERPQFQVHPGLSALQLAAARAGAPLMHDFCTISLSDRLTPWEVIERRIEAAAAGDFVVALYNPRSRERDWQLAKAIEILLCARPLTTPVVMARQLGRSDEQVSIHNLGNLRPEDVDMLTVLVIGNSSSRVQDGRMVTPRGYPGAALS